jgi:hypothetical protein
VKTLRRVLGGNRKPKPISGEPEIYPPKSIEEPLNEGVAQELLELAYKSFGAGRGALSGFSFAGP